MATCCAASPVLDPAAMEAGWLLDFAGRNGESLEAVRELIAVPAEIERDFRTFAQRHPEESIWIEQILSYRAAVLEEFNKLAGPTAPAVPADVAPTIPPDPVEEGAPDTRDLEAALAFREEIASARRFHHPVLTG